jgi:hypothetical protein
MIGLTYLRKCVPDTNLKYFPMVTKGRDEPSLPAQVVSRTPDSNPKISQYEVGSEPTLPKISIIMYNQGKFGITRVSDE